MTICRKCGKEIPDGEELCQECATKESSSGEGYLDELIQSIEMEEPQESTVKESESATDAFALGDLFSDEIVLQDLEEETEEETATEEMQEIPEELVLDEVQEIPEELVLEEVQEIPEELVLEEAQEIPEELVLEEMQEIPEELVLDEAQEISEEQAEVSMDDDINALLDLLEKDYDDYTEEEEEPEILDNSSMGMPEATVTKEAELSFFSEDEDDNIFADSDMGTSVEDIFQDALSAVEYSENEDGFEKIDDVMALDDSFSLDETATVASDSDVDGLPDELFGAVSSQEDEFAEEKEPGFFQRVFGNIITEQTAEEEEKEREKEEEEALAKAASKEEKKQQAAAKKEEKALKAQEQKEQKAILKAEMAAAKAAKKEEKKRRKAQLEAEEVIGKLNPVGTAIVMVFFGILCISVIFGSHLFSNISAVHGAQKKFEERDYEAAYESLAGVKVPEDSKEMEDKIRICMKMQRELNSYSNYYEMKMYLEALDSLMKGIRYYDENKKKAEQYEIISQYNDLESKIAGALYNEFGVSETQARSIIQSETQEEYTVKLEEIIKMWENKIKEDER